MEMISFALPKGRLAEKSIELLINKGIAGKGVVDFSSRQLVFYDKVNNLRFLLIRNSDVATYTEHGVADFGVIGKDMLEETEADVYEYYDLGFGNCRVSVAVPDSGSGAYHHNMRVATTYPNITKKFFSQKGIFVEIIKLYGSVEIAPLTGLSDCIVDVVESGETLKKNGLAELEQIMPSSARFIGNRNLARAKHERVKKILKALEV